MNTYYKSLLSLDEFLFTNFYLLNFYIFPFTERGEERFKPCIAEILQVVQFRLGTLAQEASLISPAKRNSGSSKAGSNHWRHYLSPLPNCKQLTTGL